MNDVDIEQAEFEAEGQRIASLEARGVCTHGYVQGYTAEHRPDLKPGQIQCHDCAAIFPSRAAWLDAREDAIA